MAPKPHVQTLHLGFHHVVTDRPVPEGWILRGCIAVHGERRGLIHGGTYEVGSYSSPSGYKVEDLAGFDPHELRYGAKNTAPYGGTYRVLYEFENHLRYPQIVRLLQREAEAQKELPAPEWLSPTYDQETDVPPIDGEPGPTPISRTASATLSARLIEVRRQAILVPGKLARVREMSRRIYELQLKLDAYREEIRLLREGGRQDLDREYQLLNEAMNEWLAAFDELDTMFHPFSTTRTRPYP